MFITHNRSTIMEIDDPHIDGCMSGICRLPNRYE
uniref:Uncharacterized protein n=1 Tax=Parascaris equorum TaxID=6256 RepID=A0A914RS43_PAREQ